MTPEEQAKFAADIRRFSPKDIDRLHRVLFRLQEDLIDFTPASVNREYFTICTEDRHPTNNQDPCLQWLLNLLHTDAEVPLNEKFLDILQEANIVLTTDATTEGGTDYDEAARANTSETPSSLLDRPDSPDYPDENDPRWQQAVALDNRKLASQALEQWRHKLQLRRQAYLEYEDPAMNETADRFYQRNLASKSLSHWHNTVKEIQDMDKVADNFRGRRDAAFALKQWTLAARENLFTRMKHEQLLHRALGTWREKTRDIREMEAAADEISSRRALRNTLEKMVANKSQIVQAESMAVLVYQGNLVRKIFTRWLVHLEEIQLNDRRAEAAADYFASKHVLQKWREKTRLLQQEKQTRQSRKHILAFRYFRKWRAFVRKSKNTQYTEAYKSMRRKVKMNIARAVLNNWREKTARIQAMNTTADDFRTRKDAENARRMAHAAIVTMYNKSEQTQEANQQADLFFKKKLIERLRIFGSNWLVHTRRNLENQKRADEYRATRTASYALLTLRNWRNAAFRTRRLQEDADVLFQRNEKKKALGYLQRWRQAVVGRNEAEEGPENSLIPATPAARRNQLLASTTPAYTPATGLFGAGERLIEEEEE